MIHMDTADIQVLGSVWNVPMYVRPGPPLSGRCTVPYILWRKPSRTSREPLFSFFSSFFFSFNGQEPIGHRRSGHVRPCHSRAGGEVCVPAGGRRHGGKCGQLRLVWSSFPPVRADLAGARSQVRARALEKERHARFALHCASCGRGTPDSCYLSRSGGGNSVRQGGILIAE